MKGISRIFFIISIYIPLELVYTHDLFNIENNDADSFDTNQELTNLILKKLKRYKKDKEEYSKSNPKEFQFDKLNEKPENGMYNKVDRKN